MVTPPARHSTLLRLSTTLPPSTTRNQFKDTGCSQWPTMHEQLLPLSVVSAAAWASPVEENWVLDCKHITQHACTTVCRCRFENTQHVSTKKLLECAVSQAIYAVLMTTLCSSSMFAIPVWTDDGPRSPSLLMSAMQQQAISPFTAVVCALFPLAAASFDVSESPLRRRVGAS